MNNRQILCSYLLIFVFLVAFFGLSNFFFAEKPIPFEQIAIVSLMHCMYSCLSAIIITGLWLGNRWQRLAGLLGLIVLSVTVIPLVHWLIYGLLPPLGIVFFDVTKPEDMDKFHFQILRGYAWSIVFGAAVVIYCKLVSFKKVLDKKIKTYQHRAVDNKYISHFLSTLMLTSFGRNLIDDVPEDKGTKRDVIQFLAYHFDAADEKSLGTWRDELDYLRCFVRLLRVYYGTAAIAYTEEFSGANFPKIPRGVLFFPLENCLKHALITVDHPLQFSLSGTTERLSLSCRNYWSPKEDQQQSGLGLSLLQAKLAMANFKTEVTTNLTENLFHIQIQLNFNMHEKTSI